MIGDNNSLDGFSGWSDTENEVDFFTQPQEETEDKTDVLSVIEKITEEDNQESDKDKLPTDTEVNLFETPTVNVDNDEPDDKNEIIGDESPNVYVLNKLKEKGYVNFELEDGEELTDELAEELIAEGFDESVENRVKELITDLSDDKKEAVQFLLKGGKLEDLLGAYADTDSIDINADLDKEENQIAVMKKLLSLEDKDAEEVETEIEFLKDSGKLKLMAEKKLGKYKLEIDANQKEIVKAQQLRIETEKKQIKESKTKVATFLSTNQDVDGIKISLSDKKELPSFMVDKTVKLQNGTSISEMQKVLFYDLPKNEKALIQLATLLRNRNEDGSFNFDSIEKTAQTKVVQKVRQEIRRDKSSIPGSSTNKNGNSAKSLADLFNT